MICKPPVLSTSAINTLNMFRPYPKPEPRKKKPRAGLKKKYKPTGELDLFRMIWNKREHWCVNCECIIREHRDANHNVIINPINFDHIKTKKQHPELRLVESNIRILCVTCHLIRHNGTQSEFDARKKESKYLGETH